MFHLRFPSLPSFLTQYPVPQWAARIALIVGATLLAIGFALFS